MTLKGHKTIMVQSSSEKGLLEKVYLRKGHQGKTGKRRTGYQKGYGYNAFI